MAGSNITQASFAAGEITPALYGRTDIAKYYAGLRTCRNFIVRNTGGVSNRAGSKLVGETIDSTKLGRKIPFQFSIDQSYALEFGDHLMRIIYRGAYVICPTDVSPPSGNVVGFTDAVLAGMIVRQPVLLTIESHPFSDGELVEIAGVADGMNGEHTITYIDENTIGVPGLDLMSLGAWTGAGTVTTKRLVPGEIAKIISPYSIDELQDLQYVQANDVMTLTHPNHKPTNLSRYSHWDWRFSEVATVGGPFLDINVDQSKTIIASAVTGAIDLIASFDAFDSNQVGDLLYLEQAPDMSTPTWEVQKAIVLGAIVKAGVNYYQCTLAGTTGTVKPTHLEGKQKDGVSGCEWEYLHSGSGIVRIEGVTDSKHASAVVINRLPEGCAGGTTDLAIANVAPGHAYYDGSHYMYATVVVTTVAPHGFASGSIQTLYGIEGIPGANGTWVIDVTGPTTFGLRKNNSRGTYTAGGFVKTGTTTPPTYKWAFAAWSQSQGYPASVGYFQQRQVFAGTAARSQTVNMSTTGGYNNFSVSFPMLDNDAITFTLASRDQNVIRHIIELGKLLVLTASGEWLVQGSNDVLTPASINVKRQGYNGVNNLSPLVIDNLALYVQEKGNTIRTIGYNFQNDSFGGNELSIMSRHLLEGHRIVSWAYQRVPWGCIWMVREDGILLCLTYLPEQEILAWSRHDTDGLFEDIVCISEGSEDALYATVRRTINGVDKRYVERFSNRAFLKVQDGFFVDCGLTYDGRWRPDLTIGIDANGALYTTKNGVRQTTGWVPPLGAWDTDERSKCVKITSDAGFTERDVMTLTTLNDPGTHTPPDTFTAESVGNAIHIDDSETDVRYSLTILEYIDGETVKVRTNIPLPAALQNATIPAWAYAVKHFSGLDHLEGKSVALLCDGNVEDPQIVVDGKVALQRPASLVHAGLPYTSELTTLDLSSAQMDIRDRAKLIPSLSITVTETSGLMAGPDIRNLIEKKQREDEAYAEPAHLMNGTVQLKVPTTWNKLGRVTIYQDKPLPITVLSITPEVTPGGTGGM